MKSLFRFFLPCFLAQTVFLFSGAIPAFSEEANPALLLHGIVKITTLPIDGLPKQGSGVIVQIDQEGVTILTAAHVVTGGDPNPRVEFYQQTGKAHQSTVVKGSELGNDQDGLALLRVDPSDDVPLTIRTLPIASQSGSLTPGAVVSLLSLPRVVNDWTVLHGGMVVQRGREILVDVRGSDGSSGGAIVREQQVIGLVQSRDQFLRGNTAQSVQAFLSGMGLRSTTRSLPSVINGADGAPMVLVPSGEFMMGAEDSNSEAGDDEKPQHRVYLKTFYMDQYEVTTVRYQKFLTATGHAEPKKHWRVGEVFGMGGNVVAEHYPDFPVVGITWEEANAYCTWAGKRLPTEAEWEKAARGIEGRTYPWGNEPPSSERGNFDNEIANNPFEDLKPVGSYPGGKSPYGAYDMVGNVWEWVADWYGKDYYQHSPRDNPKGPADGTYKVLRGGSWLNDPTDLRSAVRGRYGPTRRGALFGVRCVQDAP